MEEISSLKRQRDETHDEIVQEKEDVFKRQKSYKEIKDIITFLEEEEDVPNEDLSSLISTLQEEISPFSSSSPSSSEPDPAHDPARSRPFEPGYGDPSESTGPGTGPEEEERESVMRHLLEASDDELGIPNNNSNITDSFDEVVGGGDGHVDGGDFIFNGEGIWEFEEYEAANYYSMLQQHSSEIFM